MGAVSAEVAVALADGARAALDADVGVGVTGVAGPGGGSEEKPVGLVWLSVSHRDGRRLTRSVNAARRPRRHPRPLDDGRDAPRAAAAAGRRRRPVPAIVSARLRLFVALDLPATVRAALAEWCARVAPPGVRLVPEENLHVTLAFLGSRSAGRGGGGRRALLEPLVGTRRSGRCVTAGRCGCRRAGPAC